MASEWIITLVHGTWGRGFFPNDKRQSKIVPRWFDEGARWFDEGSRFMVHLRLRLDNFDIPNARIEVFRWSGSNSIIARDDAARQLSNELQNQRRLNPTAKQLVIAHSHGGNVALRALEYLGDAAEGLLIATLATPFVEIFPPEETAAYHLKKSFLYTPPLLLLSGRLHP
jgi:hypothetical protein